MQYACLGRQIVNEIIFEDGSRKTGIIGGTPFSLSGILQYSDDVTLFAGKGSDWQTYFGSWFQKNSIAIDGLLSYPEKSFLARLVYTPTGEWKEKMEFGPADLKNFERTLTAELFKRVDERTKGLYLYDSIYNEDFWETVRKETQIHHPKIMFELLTNECVSENYDHFVHKILPLVDIYSLNMPESFRLFNVQSKEAAVEEIVKLGKPCYYRCGKSGAYMIMNGKTAFVPSISVRPKEEEIDPTGCGNCSTAAALYGYAEGYSCAQIGTIAALAAAYNVLQYGPNPVFTAESRSASLKYALEEALKIPEINRKGV